MDRIHPPQKKNIFVAAWLVFSQLGYLVSLLAWFGLFGVSYMAFDEGVNALGVFLVVLIGIWPILIAGASIYAWMRYQAREFRTASWTMLVPIVYAGLFWTFLLIGAWLEE